jgi:hypothetical protein
MSIVSLVLGAWVAPNLDGDIWSVRITRTHVIEQTPIGPYIHNVTLMGFLLVVILANIANVNVYW